MKIFLLATIFATTFALSNPAAATTITLNGSIGSNLSTGNYSATFGGVTPLPQDYSINSLKYSFTFRDDANDGWTTSPAAIDKTTQGGYGYESGFLSVTYGRDVRVDQTVQRSGEKESVQLSLAGVLVDNGATSQTTSSSTSGGVASRVYDGKDCFIFCDYYYSNTTTYTTTVTTDWTGDFTLSGTVSNKTILDKLLQDDVLQVGLNVKGDLKLLNASLLLDYTETKVPEPSTILLAFAGLAGVGLARRRRAQA